MCPNTSRCITIWAEQLFIGLHYSVVSPFQIAPDYGFVISGSIPFSDV